jgi:hypothetical protein
MGQEERSYVADAVEQHEGRFVPVAVGRKKECYVTVPDREDERSIPVAVVQDEGGHVPVAVSQGGESELPSRRSSSIQCSDRLSAGSTKRSHNTKKKVQLKFFHNYF